MILVLFSASNILNEKVVFGDKSLRIQNIFVTSRETMINYLCLISNYTELSANNSDLYGLESGVYLSLTFVRSDS